MAEKLTDKALKNAKPKETQYKLFDGKGLFLLVKPDGKRYWRMKYRHNGKEKLLAIGTYPTVTLAMARDKAREAREALQQGSDPSAQRQQDKLLRQHTAENTFNAVAAEWFAKQSRHWSETHKTRVLGLLKNNLGQFIGTRPISEITPPELLAALRKTETRGIHETAKRAMQTAGQVFCYAVATGKANSDITQPLKGSLTTPTSKHFAAITDPKELGKLLVAIDGFTGTPEVRGALLLSPMLFQRPKEIRGMEWAEINWQEKRWELPAGRMKSKKPHIVPLCKQALAILEWLQPITGRGKYVFPSARGASRPLSENGVRTALRALGYTNEQQTPHGFRATARTILDEVLGYRVDWIEHQLSHKVKDANGTAYNRTAHLESRAKMMQAWADYQDTLRQSANSQGKVVLGAFGK